ncbi:MAG: TlpA disulfide reductase family protein [Hyphomonadaceae bacterium]|nr:TlpA disulfide reductase family protein [Hyphomonadaceae bacterium]
MLGEGSDPGDVKPRSWALKIGIGLAVLGFAGFLYAVFGAVSKPDASGYKRFATGAMRALQIDADAPPQSTRPFQTVDGFNTTLAAFRGDVLVVNLWATWCAPCVEEMPTLGAVQRHYDGRDLKVVPISLDQPRHRARAVEDLKRLSAGSLTFYHDPTAAIAYDSGAGAGMPMTIVYAKDGREIGRLAGAADWNSAEARALFDAALAE